MAGLRAVLALQILELLGELRDDGRCRRDVGRLSTAGSVVEGAGIGVRYSPVRSPRWAGVPWRSRLIMLGWSGAAQFKAPGPR